MSKASQGGGAVARNGGPAVRPTPARDRLLRLGRKKTTMIAFVRTTHIKPGKTGDAMKFAQAMGAFLKGSYGVEVELLRPFGGNPQRLPWSSRYADLAAMEAFNNKLLADAKYWELVNAAADCTEPGTHMFDCEFA